MITNSLKYISVVLSLVICGSSTAQEQKVLVDQNAKAKAAFLILQADIADKESFFTSYANSAEKVVTAHGGRALVATFDKDVLEGSWDNNWTIILKFSSLSAATNWYYSDAYQTLIPYRHAATSFGNMILFEGTAESLVKWNVTQFDSISPTLITPGTLSTTPEYVITVSPSTTSTKSWFVVSAMFETINYRGATLSLEMKVPQSIISNGDLDIQISLKDTAGGISKLGTVRATNFTADNWRTIQFSGNIDNEDYQHHVDDDSDGESANLTNINAVEIAFGGAEHRPTIVSGDIQIKNLRISK